MEQIMLSRRSDSLCRPYVFIPPEPVQTPIPYLFHYKEEYLQGWWSTVCQLGQSSSYAQAYINYGTMSSRNAGQNAHSKSEMPVDSKSNDTEVSSSNEEHRSSLAGQPTDDKAVVKGDVDKAGIFGDRWPRQWSIQHNWLRRAKWNQKLVK